MIYNNATTYQTEVEYDIQQGNIGLIQQGNHS